MPLLCCFPQRVKFKDFPSVPLRMASLDFTFLTSTWHTSDAAYASCCPTPVPPPQPSAPGLASSLLPCVPGGDGNYLPPLGARS